MFYKGEWYPVSTLARDVRQVVEKKYARPDRRKFEDKTQYLNAIGYWNHEIDDYVADSLSQICNDSDRLAVISNNDEIVDATNEVFEGLNVYGEYGCSSYHVHLFIGTIGSGYLLKKNGEPTREAKLEMYGQFLHCPLLMERKYVRQQLAELNEEVPVVAASSPEIVRQVVEVYQSGRILAKEDYRQLYCPEIKGPAWLAIWREVVEKCPDLAKPGRRPSGHQRPEFKI